MIINHNMSALYANRQLKVKTLELDGNIEKLIVRLERKVATVVFSKKADPRFLDPGFLARFVGEYDQDGKIIKVAIKGTGLTLTVPGQPVYDLVPALGNRFALADMPGFKVAFSFKEGKVTECVFIQPNGVFAAKRR